MFKTQSRWISFSGRALATVALMTTSGFLLHAQTAAPSGTTSNQGVSAEEPIFHLQTAQVDSDELYSSSSDEQSPADGQTTQIASNAVPALHLFNAYQYGGGRQRYGRPKYRGSNTNADGSPKYDFYVGGGFGIPVGSSFNYATTSWGFGGGGGRMFNYHVGVNIEFQYDHFGMTGATLTNQQDLYNYYINLYNQQNPGNPVSPISGLDGNNHVWSFSLQPIYNIKTGEGIGAYITGGAGFYHKVANFTEPSVGEYCDPFYGCYEYEANQTIDHYTSNAFGVDIGGGLTYKFSRFANERLFAEVRYVYAFNSYKPGVTIDNASPDNANVYNDFPYNSQHTAYLPVKFGLRF
jgi:hypothetical protein